MDRNLTLSMANATFMENVEGQGGEGTSNDTVFLTYYILVLVIGIPGNAVILIIYGKKKRKTSTDVLIIGQGIVDLLACVFTPALIVRRMFVELVTTGLCRFAYLAESSSAFTSLFFTTVISVDRYLAVCRPLRRRMTTRSSILTSMVIVVMGVSINIPRTLFEVARQKPGDDHCAQMRSQTAILSQSIAFVFLFALSLITSSAMYLVIYAFLQKRAKIHNKLVGNEVRNEPPVAIFQPRKDAKGFGSVGPAVSSLEIENISTDATEIKTDDREKFSPMMSGPSPLSSVTSSGLSKVPHPASASLTPAALATPSNAQFSTNKSQPASLSKPPSLFQRLGLRHHHPDRPRASKTKDSDMGRKTTRMLLVITVYFFATWMPQIVSSVFPGGSLEMISRYQVPDTVLDILTELRLTNHIINVFVYTMVNDGFRSSLRQMFHLRRKK